MAKKKKTKNSTYSINSISANSSGGCYITDSNGNIINTTTTSTSSPYIMPGNSSGYSQILTVPSYEFKCSSCKKIKKGYSILSYKGSKLDRNICQKCYTKTMDKLFGIKSGDLEELLFDK